jgi:hypothetical protein
MQINPNPGFMRQLQQWDRQHGQRTQRESLPYRPSSHKQHDYSTIPTRNYDKYYNRENTYSRENSYARDSLKEELPSAKKNNPEYEPYSGLALHYHYNQPNPAPKDSRLNRSVEPLTSHNYAPNSNLETLSRDLDDRINKIKQKYYDRSNYDGLSTGKADRNLSSYEELGRSRGATGGRESLRSSLYAYKSRPASYHYASFI